MSGCNVCMFINLVFDHYMKSYNNLFLCLPYFLSFFLSGRGEAFGQRLIIPIQRNHFPLALLYSALSLRQILNFIPTLNNQFCIPLCFKFKDIEMNCVYIDTTCIVI